MENIVQEFIFDTIITKLFKHGLNINIDPDFKNIGHPFRFSFLAESYIISTDELDTEKYENIFIYKYINNDTVEIYSLIDIIKYNKIYTKDKYRILQPLIYENINKLKKISVVDLDNFFNEIKEKAKLMDINTNKEDLIYILYEIYKNQEQFAKFLPQIVSVFLIYLHKYEIIPNINIDIDELYITWKKINNSLQSITYLLLTDIIRILYFRSIIEENILIIDLLNELYDYLTINNSFISKEKLNKKDIFFLLISIWKQHKNDNYNIPLENLVESLSTFTDEIIQNLSEEYNEWLQFISVKYNENKDEIVNLNNYFRYLLNQPDISNILYTNSEKEDSSYLYYLRFDKNNQMNKNDGIKIFDNIELNNEMPFIQLNDDNNNYYKTIEYLPSITKSESDNMIQDVIELKDNIRNVLYITLKKVTGTKYKKYEINTNDGTIEAKATTNQTPQEFIKKIIDNTKLYIHNDIPLGVSGRLFLFGSLNKSNNYLKVDYDEITFIDAITTINLISYFLHLDEKTTGTSLSSAKEREGSYPSKKRLYYYIHFPFYNFYVSHGAGVAKPPVKFAIKQHNGKLLSILNPDINLNKYNNYLSIKIHYAEMEYILDRSYDLLAHLISYYFFIRNDLQKYYKTFIYSNDNSEYINILNELLDSNNYIQPEDEKVVNKLINKKFPEDKMLNRKINVPDKLNNNSPMKLIKRLKILSPTLQIYTGKNPENKYKIDYARSASKAFQPYGFLQDEYDDIIIKNYPITNYIHRRKLEKKLIKYQDRLHQLRISGNNMDERNKLEIKKKEVKGQIRSYDIEIISKDNPIISSILSNIKILQKNLKIVENQQNKEQIKNIKSNIINYINEINKYLKSDEIYITGTKNNNIVRNIENFPLDNPEIYFVCQTDENPYAGFWTNKRDYLKTHKDIVYLPKCFKVLQHTKTKELKKLLQEKERRIISKEEDNNLLISSNVKDITYHVKKKLKIENPGKINKSIHIYLNIILGFERPYSGSGTSYEKYFYFTRIGMPKIKSSLLISLFYSLGYYYVYNSSTRSIEQDIIFTFNDLVNPNMHRINLFRRNMVNFFRPSLVKQEGYDISDSQLIEQLGDTNIYLNPYIFHRFFEELFNINIYLFHIPEYSDIKRNKSTQKTPLEILLPRYKNFYIQRQHNPNRNTVLLYMINTKNYKVPHIELIIISQSTYEITEFEDINNISEDELSSKLKPYKKIFSSSASLRLYHIINNISSTYEWSQYHNKNTNKLSNTILRNNIYQEINIYDILNTKLSVKKLDTDNYGQILGQFLDDYGKCRGFIFSIFGYNNHLLNTFNNQNYGIPEYQKHLDKLKNYSLLSGTASLFITLTRPSVPYDLNEIIYLYDDIPYEKIDKNKLYITKEYLPHPIHVLSFMEALPTYITRTDGIITGLWYKYYDYDDGIYFPTYMNKEHIKQIKEQYPWLYDIKNGPPNPFFIDSIGSIERLGKLRKMINYIFNIVGWFFSYTVKRNIDNKIIDLKSMDIDNYLYTYINDFVNKYLFIYPLESDKDSLYAYNLSNFDGFFPIEELIIENALLILNKKIPTLFYQKNESSPIIIRMYSNKFYNGMIQYIKTLAKNLYWFLQNENNEITNEKLPDKILNWYKDPDNLKKQPNTIIFYSEDTISSWLVDIKQGSYDKIELYVDISFNMRSLPYIYINQLNSKIYMIQNIYERSLLNAIKVSYYWYKDRINKGFKFSDGEEIWITQNSLPSHLIYKIGVDNQLYIAENNSINNINIENLNIKKSKIDISSKYGYINYISQDEIQDIVMSKPYLEILKYTEDNFAAMLPLNYN